MDGNIVGMMHLDVRQVNTDFQNPLRISIESEAGIVSGHFFNFYDHKPTFKLDTNDQKSISLSGGSLTAPYVMDQFHFHVYCTRAEAELSTLDRVQVPGEVNENISTSLFQTSERSWAFLTGIYSCSVSFICSYT